MTIYIYCVKKLNNILNYNFMNKLIQVKQTKNCLFYLDLFMKLKDCINQTIECDNCRFNPA